MDILKFPRDAINKLFNVSCLLAPHHLIFGYHLIVYGDDFNRFGSDRLPSKFDLYKDNYLVLIIHSSLLFHVKHFLEKKCFFAQQSYRIFGKNPEILFGRIPKRQLKTGNETRILMVCEGALI